jgi:cytochrome b561
MIGNAATTCGLASRLLHRVGAGLIVVHVGAAFRHLVVRGDSVMLRMLAPPRKP